MVAAKEHSPRFTLDEYFAWEQQQEVKHEYFEGEVFAMSGGTVNHGRIGGRIFSLIDDRLSESDRCIALNSDVKIKIQASEKYVYPDASATCDERDRQTTQFISHPSLIVEVLSPSTEAYDSAEPTLRERGKKFKLYQRSTSLIEYVLVSAEEIEIEVFRKNERGKWEVTNYAAGDNVELESIDLTFAIDRVYRGIEF
ncbi:Uma2 family endonuclease [Chamaesiphon sp.]|uniref:Uma2 family endonuclease n=1 Tax=Chamaesiphon sp. TaxID=2814140 RepID=UPI0035947D9E